MHNLLVVTAALVVTMLFMPMTVRAELISQQAKMYKNNWCEFVGKSVASARINALTGKPQGKALEKMRDEKPGLSASPEGGVLVQNMVQFAYTKGGFVEAVAACMDEDPTLMPWSIKNEIHTREKKARQQISSK